MNSEEALDVSLVMKEKTRRSIRGKSCAESMSAWSHGFI
jgi:hypothetical protein